MTLANGRHYLAIPGPSVMPDRVLNAMHRAAPNIYTGPLKDLVESVVVDLKTIAGTRHDVAIYIANGHGVWEAALSNVLTAGDKILVIGTGRFCIGWGEMARGLGIEVEVLDFGLHGTYDPDVVRATLEADKNHEIKAVLMVQVDTSTSVLNDVAAMRDLITATGHPALYMVDCIASLGIEEFQMDQWGVDVMVAASQKGLMTPPGIGFVYFNDKAAVARAANPRVSVYWDWVPRVNADELYMYFDGTSPTHHLFALREALDMIVHEEGLPAVYHRHKVLARAIWAAFEAWESQGPMRLNIRDKSLRSHAVTSANVGAPQGTALRDYLTQNLGVTLGIGLGMAPGGDPEWHGFFRVGHMGHINAHMVMGVLGTLEAGMLALDIPHGEGALAAAAEVIARG